MSVTTSKLVVLIIELVWALPIGRSIIAMIGGKNVFRKAYKNENSSFIPMPEVTSEVINLVLRKSPPVNVKNEKVFFANSGQIDHKSESEESCCKRWEL